jgi:peroxiredoxin (alkyl hydroperoxide reductase subunit C)
MITVGSTVPELVSSAYRRGESEPILCSLSDHDRWIVLFFYPRDFTFICPTELGAFAELESAFAAEEADLVAASTDSYWSHKAWFESHAMLARANYPVVADTSHELAEAFGVLTADGTALRGTFVIDPRGIVRHASITDMNVGRSPQEILRILQALRTGELCPVGWRPGESFLKAA